LADGKRRRHDQEDVVDTVTPERLKYYLDNKETVTSSIFGDQGIPGKKTSGGRSIPINELDKTFALFRAPAG